VVAHKIADPLQVAGVNSPVQLAQLERAFQLRLAEQFHEPQGVRLTDPARFDVRGELLCAGEVEIDVNCVFEGRVELGEGVKDRRQLHHCQRPHRCGCGDPPPSPISTAARIRS